MSTLAVIGTFYKRHENTGRLFQRVLYDSTRKPDEFWVMCEGEDDVHVAQEVWGAWDYWLTETHIEHLPTPRDESGHYTVIPYSNKINWALDRTEADYIVFLDNNSMPHENKYQIMVDALDAHPEWGAVYCTQHRTGFQDVVYTAAGAVDDAYCKLNYTQVMFRRNSARWSLDMGHASPNDVADGIFWRSLHAIFGPFYPVAPREVLDTHHIESLKAVGVE